jgi:hypothetical protein
VELGTAQQQLRSQLGQQQQLLAPGLRGSDCQALAGPVAQAQPQPASRMQRPGGCSQDSSAHGRHALVHLLLQLQPQSLLLRGAVWHGGQRSAQLRQSGRRQGRQTLQRGRLRSLQ